MPNLGMVVSLLHEADRPRTAPSNTLLANGIGLRPAQLPHPIEQFAGDHRLSFLGCVQLRTQAAAERSFVASKGVFSMRLRIATRRPFPDEDTVAFDRRQMFISLCWGVLSRVA